MVIEINKDIDRYKESVVMGLTAKQLIFSVASVAAGGGIVLLLYRYIGLTPSVYVAIPVAAPIALGGFYSFNGMGFYEYMGRKMRMLEPSPPAWTSKTKGFYPVLSFSRFFSHFYPLRLTEYTFLYLLRLCGYLFKNSYAAFKSA